MSAKITASREARILDVHGSVKHVPDRGMVYTRIIVGVSDDDFLNPDIDVWPALKAATLRRIEAELETLKYGRDDV